MRGITEGGYFNKEKEAILVKIIKEILDISTIRAEDLSFHQDFYMGKNWEKLTIRGLSDNSSIQIKFQGNMFQDKLKEHGFWPEDK